MYKIVMSGKFVGILAAAAASLSFGAVQLASGGDLAVAGRDAGQGQGAINENGVNRGAKSDRSGLSGILSGQSQTISVRLNEPSATSILIRMPARFGEEAQDRPAVPGLVKRPVNARKSMVACEPVVSVLTEVAKQLQPGRCIT
jgi:hypothetical protein